MKIIVGLGNPGDKYYGTRHNVGFMVLHKFMNKHGFDDFSLKKKLKSQISEGNVGGEKIILVKPETFMNLSGEAVVAVKNFYKVENKDIVVVYDDYDLPTGELRYREKGGSGTHNGMKSCIQQLGTDEFPRLRVGINSGLPVVDLSGYVLGKFTDEEGDKIIPALNESVLQIENQLAISGESK